MYKSEDRLVIVQEQISEPKLFPYLCQQRQYLSENQIMQVTKQLLDLLVFTHGLGIAHSQLSSEYIHVLHMDPLSIEITVSGYQFACLETIGLSSSLSPISIKKPSLSKLNCQTPAPQNEFSDLVSIGIIVFMLLVGVAPFQNKNMKKLIEEARVGYISFSHPHWKLVSPQAQAFVKTLTARRVVTAQSLRLLQNDPWFRSPISNSPLSIDIHADLRKFNLLCHFEMLIEHIP